nr:uncharacterized mitochondrial protein AtMg00810-like [Tanacetum cinerariifolium]
MSMMGELKLFLEIQIHQSHRGIFINQAKYAQEILINHGMTSCDSVGTPMATKHLYADLSGTPIDQTKYRSMVGALMYLTSSRQDIMHATCYCARYQAKSTKKHLTAVKRIFRYLKDTIHMGLWYPKDTGFELTAFQIQITRVVSIHVAISSSLRLLKLNVHKLSLKPIRDQIINLIRTLSMYNTCCSSYNNIWYQRVLCILLENLPEHPSDTKVFTVKMEILLEPTSNKLLIGTKSVLQPRSSEVEFKNHMLILKLSKSNKESSIGEIVSLMIM